jgi:hypothetical protein
MKPIESPISGTMFFGRMVGRRLSGFSRLWCGDEKREIRSEKREFRTKTFEVFKTSKVFMEERDKNQESKGA